MPPPSPPGPPPLPPAIALIVSASLPRSRWRLDELCREVEDWEQLQRLAHRHGVLPLVARRLASLPAGLVPEPVLEGFQRKRDAIARRTLAQSGELLRITRALHAEGIESLAFKGPALAESLFGTVTLRPAGDLDLLIPADSLAAADRILTGLGYQRHSPPFPLDDRRRSLVQRVRADVGYRHAAGGGSVELHWRWQRNPSLMRFDAARIWNGARPHPLAGSTLAVPDPQELFLYLCVHGNRHLWERLKWLADIAWWLEGPSGAPPWETLAARAREVGAMTSLTAALMLLERLTGTGAPPPGADDKELAAARAMTEVSLARLARTTHPSPSSFRELTRVIWMEWRMSDSWRARLQGIVWIRFLRPNDNDLATLTLPPRLSWLYVPLKPWLWLLRRIYGLRRSDSSGP